MTAAIRLQVDLDLQVCHPGSSDDGLIDPAQRLRADAWHGIRHHDAVSRAGRLRVGGDVESGSIVRAGREVAFTLHQKDVRLKVVYDGAEPLPDTFRDGAQALADGRMGTDGVFRASKIQAKCASKYEAKPGQKTPAAKQAGV